MSPNLIIWKYVNYWVGVVKIIVSCAFVPVRHLSPTFSTCAYFHSVDPVTVLQSKVIGQILVMLRGLLEMFNILMSDIQTYLSVWDLRLTCLVGLSPSMHFWYLDSLRFDALSSYMMHKISYNTWCTLLVFFLRKYKEYTEEL